MIGLYESLGLEFYGLLSSLGVHSLYLHYENSPTRSEKRAMTLLRRRKERNKA